MSLYSQNAKRNQRLFGKLDGVPPPMPGSTPGAPGTPNPQRMQKNPNAPKLPPFMTYDPQIDAQRRKQGRGLKDILHDSNLATQYAQQDYNTKVGDINTSAARGYQDIGTRFSRGMEDFSTRLSNLIRNVNQQGAAQTQAQNAAGVLDSSTAAASAATRTGNYQLARQPIDTGIQRLGQDTQLAYSRLGEDTQRNLGLAGTNLGRTTTDLSTKVRRAKREQQIGNLDLINEAIFNARQNKPGAFTVTGQPKNKKKK